MPQKADLVLILGARGTRGEKPVVEEQIAPSSKTQWLAQALKNSQLVEFADPSHPIGVVSLAAISKK